MLRDPPVVPGVNVNVTVPVGAFVAVVVSATVAVTLAVQLVLPRGMLQVTAPTVVEVLSFAETLMLTGVGVVVAPNGKPVTIKV